MKKPLLCTFALSVSMALSPLSLAKDDINDTRNIFAIADKEPPIVFKNSNPEVSITLKKTVEADSFFRDVSDLAEELYTSAKDSNEITVRTDQDYDGTHELIINNRVNKSTLKYSLGSGISETYGNFEIKMVTFVNSKDGNRKLTRVVLHAKTHGEKAITINFTPKKEAFFYEDNAKVTISESNNGEFVMRKKHLKGHFHPASHKISEEVRNEALKIKEKKLSEKLHKNDKEMEGYFEKKLIPKLSRSSVVENNYTASVLYLFDRNLMNKVSYNTIRQKVVGGMQYMRDLMYEGQ